MAVAQIGTTLSIGAGTVAGSDYVVHQREEDDKDVEMEDVDDENGELLTRIVFKKHPKIVLDMVCKPSADPTADFPRGEIAAHSDFTSYFVDDMRTTKTKSAKKVNVTLTNIGIT
jgi:hypothetical protein